MEAIAVSGGIGSGKSMVCHVLQCLGYKVYDCDSHARQIMESDSHIKHAIAREISSDAVDASGHIDRHLIASVVFSDMDKLAALNRIVHGAVRDDIARWMDTHRGERRLFIETAILYQSGIDRMVDEVWEVTAPEEVRVRRVCRRNGVCAEEVRSRIQAQIYAPECRHPREISILNDDEHSVLMQIDALLNG